MNKLPVIVTAGVLAGAFVFVDFIEGIEGKRKEHSHPEQHSFEYLQYAGAAQVTSAGTFMFSSMPISRYIN